MNATAQTELNKYSVIGNFLSDTYYIIPPFNNHVRFYSVWPKIPGSRPLIEFIKGNDKDPDGDLILIFTADCEIIDDNLIVRHSDFGLIWETSIPLSRIIEDLKFRYPVSKNEVALCAKKGCNEPVYEFGYCLKHYCISEETVS